jgi:hypothetical protein
MWIGEAKCWGAVGGAERRRRLGHANRWSSARQAARKVVRREQDSGAQGKGKRNRKRGQGDAKTRKEPTPNNGKLRWPGSVWGEGEMRRVSEQELPKRPECTAGRALAGTAVPSLTAPLACTDDGDWERRSGGVTAGWRYCAQGPGRWPSAVSHCRQRAPLGLEGDACAVDLVGHGSLVHVPPGKETQAHSLFSSEWECSGGTCASVNAWRAFWHDAAPRMF